ncbi:beta-propeller domain-containing protein [Halapricum hydrolyticum]|uniref:Beta-propeller domain-containing protein n=1 Tax=Halapricum hydrolyticum TaxID=2979991 RepID=A0AAE3ICH5_9EURY|nr:beta-propeller domain-containing protein [Halapricum hydrolyticum]MCU4718029.1 beta-propeller domain-containing protein [Halapricum hydrolyticum]MCU4727194.1 beta-propeller domain-containing protein [Halapricum hydrolyticum]
MDELNLGAIVVVALLVGSVVGAGVATVAISDDGSTPDDIGDGPNGDDPGLTDPGSDAAQTGVTTFESVEEFQQYVQNSPDTARSGFWLTPQTFDLAVETDATRAEASEPSDTNPDRHSSTNVQVAGIDEPDRLKTTGDHAYYADRPVYRIQPVLEGSSSDVDDTWDSPGTTHVIDSSDPAAPERITGIDQSGKLLLSGDSLVVFQGSRLVGYDVSDPAEPRQTWERSVNGTIETARLLDGQLYVVTQSPVSPGMDCPVEPLEGSAIPCTSIYRPHAQIPVDATYTAYELDPADGAIADSVSVVGTRDRSAIYMSENALYVTYTQRTQRGEVIAEAVRSDRIDAPGWVERRVSEIQSYNLSARAMEVEVEATIQQWFDGVPADEREAVRSTYQDGLQAYVDDHRRELATTGIARIGVGDGLSVEATGQVPGEPLDQFSLDEHNGTLRIATTIPRQFGTESVNDLYTLEADSLERQGSVTDMGQDQRVYAVRYVGDTAYVVTFRQIDPFHVIDLSDPANPGEVGELELPGYSSYLHPIDDGHVLGIGEEDGTVKATLFDASDPSDPTIDDTYYPGSRWSAIAESHHAFLIDRKHEVFFLPGDSEGYVVDYTDGELTETARIRIDGQPQRAAYIGDHLYVFSDQELVVMDETDWSKTDSIELP